MLPSLYSGISGLKVNQQKLNIVANNIANSSTTGFKTQSMNFEDLMSQNLSDPSAPTTGSIGGVNGKQSGLGVKIAGISTDFTPGSMQTTNRNLDFALDGTGYFVVKSGSSEYYTRDGAFTLDKNGTLLTQDGYYVQKTGGGNITIPVDGSVSSFSVGKDGTITLKYADSSKTPDSSQQIELASFQNEGGLVKEGGNLYVTSSNSGAPLYRTTANSSTFGNIAQGSLEMSNVDLAQQFTDMIIASRAFSANGKIISTDDEILQELVNLKRS